MDLFTENSIQSEKLESSTTKPLAAQNRPRTWDELVGQDQHLAPGRPLRKILDSKSLQSLIIWGPPGTGKSSFSKLVVSHFKDWKCYELLATETGTPEIKRIIQELSSKGQRGILVVDEFHRFSKLQQDVFLRSVEEGDIVLVGLTTENPKHFLNRALLSRLEIVEFKKHSLSTITTILERGWARSSSGIPFLKNELSNLAIHKIAVLCDGDARLALNFLERLLSHADFNNNLSVEALEQLFNELGLNDNYKSMDPELHYRWASDYIKAMRRGDEAESLSRLKSMIDHGEDPLFISRRQIIFAAEDVGLASPTLQSYVQSIFEGVKSVGMPEAKYLLVAGTLACCRARKSREVADKLS